MKLFISIIFTLLCGCQASFNINPKILPKQINFSELYLYDEYENKTSLKQISDKNDFTVIIFWQSKCPCVKRYQNRVTDLHEKYQDHANFIYVFSNTNESFTNAVNEYKKRNSPILLLHDKDQSIANTTNARGTPTALLLNSRGQIIFMGWIDNERPYGETARVPYLENAINHAIKGQKIKQATSPMFGCPII